MRKHLWFLLLLFSCAFVFSSVGCAESGQRAEDDMSYQAYLLKAAELPRIPPCPDMSDPSGLDEEKLAQYAAWWEAKAEQQRIVIPGVEQIQDFVRESTREFAADQEKSNFLYSPVSLWLCLNTLSDMAEGDSRAQIQRVIGQLPEGEQDAQSDAVFRSLYWEGDGAVCTPANSVWLNTGTSMSETLLKQLAARAHSSVFQGEMGESAFDEALQGWLNEQTRGLLKDSVSGLGFSSDAGLAVCSTLYMKNGWSLPFGKSKTAPDVFHTDTGEVTTDFMHSSGTGVVYGGDGFSAVLLDLSDGGSVAFILPEEGRSPEELLKADDLFRFLFAGRNWEDGRQGKIKLSIPKMDCLTGMSLRSALEKMGITDIFDPQKARFSAEIMSDAALAVTTLQQYARLILNEEGVEAAAITITLDGAMLIRPEDEIDFTLNRPFVYAVLSDKGIPLFIGTYHVPE